MADLNSIEAADITKIVGSTATGVETTPVASSLNGDLQTSDISNFGGLEGALTIGTSVSEAKVGASSLSNRKTLTIFNNSNNTIYWGYTNSVTSSSGTPLYKNQFISWDIGPNTHVYLIATSTGNNVRITENA